LNPDEHASQSETKWRSAVIENFGRFNRTPSAAMRESAVVEQFRHSHVMPYSDGLLLSPKAFRSGGPPWSPRLANSMPFNDSARPAMSGDFANAEITWGSAHVWLDRWADRIAHGVGALHPIRSLTTQRRSLPSLSHYFLFPRSQRWVRYRRPSPRSCPRCCLELPMAVHRLALAIAVH
jgi:hypothetical protein